MRGYPINIEALHQYFWRRKDRLDRVIFSQKDLAKELGAAHETINRVVSRMMSQGRLKKIGSRKHNVGVYMIKDPEGFQQE